MSDLSELRSVVGEEHALEASASDTFDGVTPRLTARPGSAEEVSALLSLASRKEWAVGPRGSGSRMGLGNAPRKLDLIVDMSRLDRLIEHAAGDLVATVEAGVRLDVLQARLGDAGQMLALDPPGPAGTIGGLIATDASGPRRLRYGTVRDLLIGITLVLPDGTVAKAGGKVVKNVAGYDLSKLMAGSLGTLGIIVQAIFRLHPLPPSRRLVEVELPDAHGIGGAVQRLLHSTLVPSAIQLHWRRGSGPTLAVLIEGVEPSVISQSTAAAEMLDGAGAARIHDENDSAVRWQQLVSTASLDDSVRIKITCLPAAVGEIAKLAAAVGQDAGEDWTLTGTLGNGVLHLQLGGTTAETAAAAVSELRTRIRPGSVVLLHGPPALKQQVEVWGPIGNSLDLMKRVKNQFDPDHLLNPGRFVGGI